MGLIKDTVLFEREDHLYLVAPVAPFDLSEQEITELAFADTVRKSAPNQNLLWLRGQYVEAERTNKNGQTWAAGDLEIASLTPNMMPVTVMHDPRTAVGLIADTKLLTPDKDKVPRARIDADLAVWAHRFPEVAEEIAVNHQQGSLMQSMECLPKWTECLECGKRFPKLPGGAERAMWCNHFEEKAVAGAANTVAARRLGAVTFTGTGLIFGTQGATGALDTAHLDVLQDEVAEFHERSAAPPDKRRPTHRRTSQVDIEQKEYEGLVAAKSKADELATKVASLEETAAKVPDLESKLEVAEAAKTKAEGEAADLKKKVDEADELARATTLRDTRMGTLGAEFTGKLGDFTKGRLQEQAKTLSDEEWDNRLKELEELSSVKRDAGEAGGAASGTGSAGDGTLTPEETARAAGGSGAPSGGGSTEPTPVQRKGVIGALVAGPKKEAA